MHGLFSFAIITDDREFLLAASSEEEKYKWMEVRFKKTKAVFYSINHFSPKLFGLMWSRAWEEDF